MIRLAKPHIPDAAIAAVVEVLKSGDLVQGKYVKEFEQKLMEYLDIENAVVVSSGTAALHLSLIALGIGQGDEVGPGIHLWSQREDHEPVDAGDRGCCFRDDPYSGAADSLSGSTSGVERTGRQGC